MNRSSRAILAITVLSLLAFFQNCTQSDIRLDSVASSSAASGGGNGEPYSGKIKVYHAYSPGFSCKNDAGEDVPSPFMIIQEFKGVFKLVEEACVKKDEVIPNEEISVSKDGSLQYRERSLQEIIADIGGIQKEEFYAPEVSCTETDQSRIMRTFGHYPVSEIEMPDAVTDIFYASIQINSQGERIAKVSMRRSVRVFNPGNDQTEYVNHLGKVNAEVVQNVTNYTQPLQGFGLTVESVGPGKLLPIIPGSLDYSPYGIQKADLGCTVFPILNQPTK